MNMGYDNAVNRLDGLSIYLTSSDNKTPGSRCLDFARHDILFVILSGLFVILSGAKNLHPSQIKRLLQRRHNPYPFGSLITGTRNHDVKTFRKRTSDGLECLAAHDYRTAQSGPFEELEILRNMPQELIVASYGIIVCYCYYD
jgi:hypothetical protein